MTFLARAERRHETKSGGSVPESRDTLALAADAGGACEWIAPLGGLPGPQTAPRRPFRRRCGGGENVHSGKPISGVGSSSISHI